MENVNGFARFTLSFAIPHFCLFSEPRGVKNSAIRKEKPLKFIENPSRCLLKRKYRNNADILVLETFSVVLNLMGHNLKTKKLFDFNFGSASSDGSRYIQYHSYLS